MRLFMLWSAAETSEMMKHLPAEWSLTEYQKLHTYLIIHDYKQCWEGYFGNVIGYRL